MLHVHPGSRDPLMSIITCCLSVGLIVSLVSGCSLFEIAPQPSLEQAPAILVLVEESLIPHIAQRLSVFEDDLAIAGYSVWRELLSRSSSPRRIRQILQDYHSTYGIVGAFLIGDLPAAYFEAHTGDFSDSQAIDIVISLDATDMYYMDLDGTWDVVSNLDYCQDAPPNIASCYTIPSVPAFESEYIVYLDEEKEWDYSSVLDKAQYDIEIWVARIMGHNLSFPGKTEADIINQYLAKNHGYRSGQWSVADTAYLCDAIASPVIDHDMDFSGIFASTSRYGLVEVGTYTSLLSDPRGCSLMFLGSHSGPAHHTFDTPGTALSVSALEGIAKNAVFYMLNACSACRWDYYVTNPSQPNYLGGMYMFAKDHANGDFGLCAVGFTGTGGFNWLSYFTDWLQSHPSSSYAEALKYWFNKNLDHIFTIWNYVILGDPTICPR